MRMKQEQPVLVAKSSHKSMEMLGCVHSVYEKIAPYFNGARYKAWPKVQQFISEQEPGGLVADIDEWVIHHFSTEERCMRAIKEIAHILRVGGQIMIYMWAMEQKQRRFEKQDVFVPWNPSPSADSRWVLGGAWLRCHHVFKEGALAELIERHIPELRITHSYFNHANWCVIAEKTEVWKI
ncbi:putative tRNA methyltransferase 9-like protein [Columba livia]|uniref:Putative tRNA methyltransferase 9-like protein n=1 Tax=Columba livia TaxID=8932 RepID=A0A2I0MD08_COLLI|nr:putative tRNA methyltransferase 9-like protein [Columba livia]